MPTLTVTSVAGDTTTKVLNYSAPDAQKIFDLWTKYIWNMTFIPDNGAPPALVPPPPPTHQDFTNWCAKHLADTFQSWNQREGAAITTPPPIGIS